MNQKYKIPLEIFIVFEKIPLQVWTSEANLPNQYFIHIPQKWFFSVNIFIKQSLSFFNSTLLDMSAVDLQSFNKNFFKKNINIKNNGVLVFYLYYFYFLKININIFFLNLNLKKFFLNSIDKIYLNSNWLEREAAEMFGLNFLNKKDIRKLLTDYTCLDNPLLKSFPCEGFYDVYYNFFEDQVKTSKNSVVEL